MSAKDTSALVVGVLSSLFFVTLNVAMNIYMKWLFTKEGGDFALPWTMLAVQQLQAFMVLQPCIAYRTGNWGWDLGMSSSTPEGEGNGDSQRMGLGARQVCRVLAVTALFCLNVGLNSLSLVHISITLNQTVRAFLPVGVLLLGRLFEEREYPGHSYVTTVVLVIGIALTCWGSPGFQPFGFSLAFLSTLVAAVGTSLNGRLLRDPPFNGQGNSRPLGVARLVLLQSVPAFCIFSVIAGLTEGRRVAERLADPNSRWPWYGTMVLVTGSSALALLSNLGRCFLVAATSALMETLAGNAKVAALCIIDHQLFGTALFFHNYFGIALTFAGFSIHVLLQYADKGGQEKKGPEGEGEAQENGAAAEAGEQALSQRNKNRQRTQVRARARLISGSETGFLAEHLAVALGRSQKPRSGSDDSIPEITRPRSRTWPATGPESPRSAWMKNLDMASVMEAPGWLVGTGPPSPEDYDSLSGSSYSPMHHGHGGSPQARTATKHSANSPSRQRERTRFFTDPVESNRSRGAGEGGRTPQAGTVRLLEPVDEQDEDSLPELGPVHTGEYGPL